MPQNVRNFWVTAVIDGKETPIAFGPRSKDGGMDITIKIRDEGEVIEALSILGRHKEGKNRIIVRDELYHRPDLVIETTR